MIQPAYLTFDGPIPEGFVRVNVFVKKNGETLYSRQHTAYWTGSADPVTEEEARTSAKKSAIEFGLTERYLTEDDLPLLNIEFRNPLKYEFREAYSTHSQSS